MQVISIILILFIYLIKGGPPVSGQNAGSTDILISWVYNLTFEFNNFNMGAVVSLIIDLLLQLSHLFNSDVQVRLKMREVYKMTKKKNILKAIGIYGFIAMMFVIILYPLLWTFGISLNPGTNLYGAKMIPDNATFKNYAFLLFDDSSQYLTWYKNTLIVASANALFSVIFVTLTAYAFSRYRFVGRKYGLITF